jgi:hypothetical protein
MLKIYSKAQTQKDWFDKGNRPWNVWEASHEGNMSVNGCAGLVTGSLLDSRWWRHGVVQNCGDEDETGLRTWCRTRLLKTWWLEKGVVKGLSFQAWLKISLVWYIYWILLRPLFYLINTPLPFSLPCWYDKIQNINLTCLAHERTWVLVSDLKRNLKIDKSYFTVISKALFFHFYFRKRQNYNKCIQRPYLASFYF